MISGQRIGFPAERWQRFCPSRNASKFEEGAGFAAKASSPQVLAKEPRGAATFRNRHTKGSRAGDTALAAASRRLGGCYLFVLGVSPQGSARIPHARPLEPSSLPLPGDWARATQEPGGGGSSSPGTQGASLQLGGETRGRCRRWGRGGCRSTRLWPRPRAERPFGFLLFGRLKIGGPRVSRG